MHVQLLGDLRISHEGRVVELGGRRQRCVLAVLLLEAGKVVPIDRIVARVWPGDQPDTAADLVTSYLSRLRRALLEASADGQIRLRYHRPGYVATVHPDQVDAHLFERLLRQAKSDLDGLDPDLAVRRLHEALGLWRGDALADLAGPWLDEQRTRLEQLRLAALEQVADLELRAGRPDRVAADLHRFALDHPHRERLTVLAVRALAASGAPGQAAELAEQAVRGLREQGLEPSTALREARQEALRPGGRTPVALLAPYAPEATRLARLPADASAFTGRARELIELVSMTEGDANRPLTCLVEGMPGIGKTAFAVRAGRLLADRFPDGQLFLDLHGFTPGTAPTGPDEALDRLLRALGVPAGHIPLDFDGRRAAYRRRLAGTRTLIVLDNAVRAAQVLPLLADEPGCLVLITSRAHPAGLADVHTVTLGALSDAEAASLFTKVAGPGRVADDDPALDQILSMCANVPLTVRVLAARLRHRPSWPLRHLVERMRDQLRRLAKLDDDARGLAAALTVSYEHLTGEEQGLFRLLGLHPGSDIDLFAAAAMVDSAMSTADLLLDGLVNHNLLMQTSSGRYQIHDLIHEYASSLSTQAEPGERRTATNRLLNYYLYSARRADRLLTRDNAGYGPPVTRKPAAPPALVSETHALMWVDAERANLAAVIDHCADSEFSRYVPALADAMHSALGTQGHWLMARRIQMSALAVAERAGDRKAQANALFHQSEVYLHTTMYSEAVATGGAALDLYRESGDRIGEAKTVCVVAQAQWRGSNLGQAQAELKRALELYADLGDWRGEAHTLTILGAIEAQAGQYSAAQGHLERALALNSRFGNRPGQAAALRYLGEVYSLTGRTATAVRTLNRALDLYQGSGDRQGEDDVRALRSSL